MAQKAFTMIFYIVPEDSDDIEHPNAYGIHKNQEDIKPSDIAETFPLPGEYVFRYRYKFQNHVVWMDINSSQNKIPLFNGKIQVKATRVSWTKSKGSSQVEQNSTTQPVRQQSSQNVSYVPIKAQQNQNQQYHQQRTNEYQEQYKNSTQKLNNQPENNIQNKSTNLLDDYDKKPNQKNQQHTSKLEADLLDMDDFVGSSTNNNQPKQNKANDDLWNF